MAVDSPVPPDLWGLAGAILISILSGFISISQRILSGQKVHWLWVVSEWTAALLCGYLAWDAYPALEPIIPEWITPFILVAFAAHAGGRSFQIMERLLAQRYSIPVGNRQTRSDRQQP